MKRLVLFLCLGLTQIQANVTLQFNDGTTLEVNEAFTIENETLKNLIADLGNSDDEPIPVLNKYVTQHTVQKLQELVGKTFQEVQAVTAALNQTVLAQTIFAANYLANNHTDDLIKALADKVLTLGLTPEVSQLFEDLKMSNGISTVTSIYNEDIRNKLIDALLKKGPPTNLTYTLQGHTGWVRLAVFSPDGLRIVTASDDSTAKLWNAQTGELIHTLQGHTNAVKSAVFSPDGSRILTISLDNAAKLWNAQTGQLIHTLQGHTNIVDSAVFSPDRLLVATASKDSTAKLWNAHTGELIHTLEGHTNGVNSAVFSPDGLHIAIASDDSIVKLWNAHTGELIYTLQGHTNMVNSAIFSPDGLRIVTASYDKTAKVWDAQTGQLIHTLEGHTYWVISAVFSPDGLRILTASYDHTAKLWNAQTGQLIHTLEGHTNGVNSAVFSPDGSRIVTASDDTTAKVWDPFLNFDYIKEYGWNVYDVPLAQVIRWAQTGKVEKAPKNIFKDLSTTFKSGMPSTYAQLPLQDAPAAAQGQVPPQEEELD